MDIKFIFEENDIIRNPDGNYRKVFGYENDCYKLSEPFRDVQKLKNTSFHAVDKVKRLDIEEDYILYIERYPKIKRIGHSDNEEMFQYASDKVYITEKLDGSNGRMWVDDGKLCFGSNNVSDIDHDGQFGRYVKYLKRHVDANDLDQDYIYVGEYMRKHSLSYPDDIEPVIFYDILYKENGCPIDYNVAIEEFKRLGLEYIEPLYTGKWSDIRDNLDEFLEDSEYRDGKPEGIVIKNYERTNRFGRPLFAKKVNEDFKEKHKAKFKDQGGKKKSKIFNQMIYLRNSYITEARIRKQIYRLRDEKDMEISRPMMNYLIPMVIEDTLREEATTIYNDDKIYLIDFEVLQQHKVVPIKCLETIDKMMDEKIV